MDMNVVHDLLNKYWDRRLPVEPVHFAHALGYEVVSISPFDTNPENQGISGYASMVNGNPVVAYHSTEHPNRQRFTIAHEIGHHLLGHVRANAGRCLRDHPSSYTANNNTYIEAEANEFAAQLLMPEEAVRILIERRGVTSITELARAFNVSEAAMYYRLKNLGLAR
ncbi:ImmA/IrrE family metallo-endopeptidase [Aeromonas caviae]|uniref:ImmA/IrrE family metallo-endopeptidase n=1 Tax=Aeromonas caviae TaxID=648 RepID=UPI001EEFA91D|nr:ImmA/IrrE family metallo-endopeptidase [Aeromonas caviae]ULH02515.1 ImmA/IrrE family metallo-endopeptidase [Aeromonas caviae]